MKCHTSITPEQGLIQEGVFAFFLGADGPGELTIGGLDEERYEGEITYTPLKNASYWAVALDGLTVTPGTAAGGNKADG